METIQTVALVIFIVTFFFILTERIHRTVIGLFGAVAMVIAGIMLDFYHPEDLPGAIDFNTLGLLFGMMLLVSMLEKTGFFQYVGIWTAKRTRGNPWMLMIALGAITGVFSMILDNVTTVILVVPMTIIIADILKINPVPIIMSEALISNIAGTGTLIGDPPNIMIGSAVGFSFNDFLVHSLPVTLVAWFATLVIFRIIYRKDLKKKPENIEQLMAMDENEAVKEPETLKKLLVVFAITIALFFLHGVLHLEPAMVAIIGASLALIVVAPKHDPQHIIEKCELSVLLFFGSLFVIVGGLEHAGVLEELAKLLTSGAADNVLMTAIIILWASAFLSAIVDNIPLTVAMIPIITYLGTQGIPTDILWWALVFGVGFGGNGSPIGSSAGVIVMAKSEKTEHPISFLSWMKQGLPTMIVCLVVATGALVFFTEHFSTHEGMRASATVEAATDAITGPIIPAALHE
jgi:Na+/H+ antiporter NhaD/arsenite permease-like protein